MTRNSIDARFPALILAVPLLVSSLLLGGCFDPELGPNPFLCASSGKLCPDGYSCRNKVCVRDDVSDAGGPKPEQKINPDGLKPTKDGTVYLDGAAVKPPGNCLDKDVEPNNSGATATPITGQGFVPNWEICYPGDVDQYKIKLEAGQKLIVKVKFYNSKGDLDAALVDPGGFVVDSSRGEKDDETVHTTAVQAGGYVLGVYGFGTAVNSYDLDVTIN
jgi:hypothetical protein